MRASPPLYLQSPCYFFSHRASAARAAVAGTYIMLEVNMLTLIVKGQCAFERFKKGLERADVSWAASGCINSALRLTVLKPKAHAK